MVSFRSLQRSGICFSRQPDIILFLLKQYFFRRKVLTEYVFLPMSETEFLSIKYADREKIPQKNIPPPGPLQVKWMLISLTRTSNVTIIFVIPKMKTTVSLYHHVCVK